MPLRCYFLDEKGHILGVEVIHDSLDTAIARGSTLARMRSRCDSIEIWRGTERLHNSAVAVTV